jgi:hypothetical protein
MSAARCRTSGRGATALEQVVRAGLVLLVLPALATGCGESAAHHAYLERANAICHEGRARIEALGRPKPGESPARLMRRGVEVARGTLLRLRAIRAPAPEVAADMERVYEELGRQIDLTRRAAAAADRADLDEMRAQLRLVLMSGQVAGAIAGRHGLIECLDHTHESPDSH